MTVKQIERKGNYWCAVLGRARRERDVKAEAEARRKLEALIKLIRRELDL